MAVSGITEYVNIALGRNQANAMDSLAVITKRLVERQQSEQREKAVNFDRPELFRANQQKAELLSFKAKTANNIAAATKAKNAIEWVSSTLTSIKNSLDLVLGSSDPEARAAAAAAFQANLDKINERVDGANQIIGNRSINLVGNADRPGFDVDSLYARSSQKGGYVMMEGAYLGTRFNIEDADGFLWRLDEGGSQYIQYKSDGTGEQTGNTVSAEGLTLDSFDADTGAAVFGGSGSLSGTVVRGGLGLLSSEFYNDFADDEAVQRAIDDVAAAIIDVGTKGAPITANATLLESNIRLLNEKVEKLERQSSRLVSEQLDEISAEKRAANLKLQLAINNINLTSQASSGLIENMLSLSGGPDQALGVFGFLGY